MDIKIIKYPTPPAMFKFNTWEASLLNTLYDTSVFSSFSSISAPTFSYSQIYTLYLELSDGLIYKHYISLLSSFFLNNAINSKYHYSNDGFSSSSDVQTPASKSFLISLKSYYNLDAALPNYHPDSIPIIISLCDKLKDPQYIKTSYELLHKLEDTLLLYNYTTKPSLSLIEIIIMSALSRCKVWSKILHDNKVTEKSLAELSTWYRSMLKLDLAFEEFQVDPNNLSKRHFKDSVKKNLLKRSDPKFLEAVYTGNFKKVKELLIYGVDIETIDPKDKNKRASHITCETANLEMLKLLVLYGCNLEAEDIENVTPINYAIQSENIPLLDYLIAQGVDLEHREYQGRTPFYWACSFSLDIVKYMYSKGCLYNVCSLLDRTPLNNCCYTGRIDIVKFLLDLKDIEIHKADYKGRTALHSACWGAGGYFEGKKFGYGNPVDCPEAARMLLERGSGVDVKDKEGNTPLHVAAGSNGWLSIRVLIEYGAKINERNGLGETPVLTGIKWKNIESVKELIEKHNADLWVEDDGGISALEGSFWKRNFIIWEYFMTNKEVVVRMNQEKVREWVVESVKRVNKKGKEKWLKRMFELIAEQVLRVKWDEEIVSMVIGLQRVEFLETLVKIVTDGLEKAEECGLGILDEGLKPSGILAGNRSKQSENGYMIEVESLSDRDQGFTEKDEGKITETVDLNQKVVKRNDPNDEGQIQTKSNKQHISGKLKVIQNGAKSIQIDLGFDDSQKIADRNDGQLEEIDYEEKNKESISENRRLKKKICVTPGAEETKSELANRQYFSERKQNWLNLIKCIVKSAVSFGWLEGFILVTKAFEKSLPSILFTMDDLQGVEKLHVSFFKLLIESLNIDVLEYNSHQGTLLYRIVKQRRMDLILELRNLFRDLLKKEKKCVNIFLEEVDEIKLRNWMNKREKDGLNALEMAMVKKYMDVYNVLSDFYGEDLKGNFNIVKYDLIVEKQEINYVHRQGEKLRKVLKFLKSKFESSNTIKKRNKTHEKNFAVASTVNVEQVTEEYVKFVAVNVEQTVMHNQTISEQEKINSMEVTDYEAYEKRLFDIEHSSGDKILTEFLEKFEKSYPTGILNKVIDDKKLVLVNDEETLKAAAAELKGSGVIGVDVEYFTEEATIMENVGFVCLIQISTTCLDFIIDAILLREKIGKYLSEVFESDRIIKVFHGCESDLIWLKSDFDIDVINLFDTCRAHMILNEEKVYSSLASLAKSYLGLVLPKVYQTADWRIRPLPQGMLDYARKDSSVLVYLWWILSRKLKEKQAGMRNMAVKMNRMCFKVVERSIVKKVKLQIKKNR